MKSKKEILVELIILIVLLIIVCVGALTGCKSAYEYKNTVQTATMVDYEYVYNKEQLDSTLYINNLPVNFYDEWLKAAYVDYETNEPITQYFYYRMNDYNEITSIYKITYDIVDTDTIYNYSWKVVNTLY